MSKSKFILKTIADCSIAGLISIGAFQSPTFIIESLTGYVVLVLLLFTILFVMSTYALGKNIEMITVVWFITIPSIIIFDKILG